jgi:hypothetical protein
MRAMRSPSGSRSKVVVDTFSGGLILGNSDADSDPLLVDPEKGGYGEEKYADLINDFGPVYQSDGDARGVEGGIGKKLKRIIFAACPPTRQTAWLILAYLTCFILVLGLSRHLSTVTPYENNRLAFLLIGDWGMPGEPQVT